MTIVGRYIFEPHRAGEYRGNKLHVGNRNRFGLHASRSTVSRPASCNHFENIGAVLNGLGKNAEVIGGMTAGSGSALTQAEADLRGTTDHRTYLVEWEKPDQIRKDTTSAGADTRAKAATESSSPNRRQ
jgi:hypothetical protein